jgi:hypothetical protein
MKEHVVGTANALPLCSLPLALALARKRHNTPPALLVKLGNLNGRLHKLSLLVNKKLALEHKLTSCRGGIGFVEVSPDEGDIDMVRAMLAYREVDYPYMVTVRGTPCPVWPRGC